MILPQKPPGWQPGTISTCRLFYCVGQGPARALCACGAPPAGKPGAAPSSRKPGAISFPHRRRSCRTGLTMSACRPFSGAGRMPGLLCACGFRPLLPPCQSDPAGRYRLGQFNFSSNLFGSAFGSIRAPSRERDCQSLERCFQSGAAASLRPFLSLLARRFGDDAVVRGSRKAVQ